MIPFNREIEVKIDASSITEASFCRWMKTLKPFTQLLVIGPDEFFSRGNETIRHRMPPGEPSQLTIKKRRSRRSITDRSEVDLELASVDPQLVRDFLVLAGFKLTLKLHKRARIFWFRKGKEEVVVSYYTAQKTGKPSSTRSFIEIEIAKGSALTIKEAKQTLIRWIAEINSNFDVKASPLNYSLFEIFTKER